MFVDKVQDKLEDFKLIQSNTHYQKCCNPELISPLKNLKIRHNDVLESTDLNLKQETRSPLHHQQQPINNSSNTSNNTTASRTSKWLYSNTNETNNLASFYHHHHEHHHEHHQNIISTEQHRHPGCLFNSHTSYYNKMTTAKKAAAIGFNNNYKANNNRYIIYNMCLTLGFVAKNFCSVQKGVEKFNLRASVVYGPSFSRWHG